MRRSLVLLFALAGCQVPKAVPIEDTKFAASLNVDLAQSTRLDPIYFRDLEVGTGDFVKKGAVATLRYVGWLADGTMFDANQAAGFSYQVGNSEVIAGWELGVAGVDEATAMKVGGTRQLILPPSVAYGDSGAGPIPPNAVLVFNVTLMSLR